MENKPSKYIPVPAFGKIMVRKIFENMLSISASVTSQKRKMHLLRTLAGLS